MLVCWLLPASELWMSAMPTNAGQAKEKRAELARGSLLVSVGREDRKVPAVLVINPSGSRHTSTWEIGCRPSRGEETREESGLGRSYRDPVMEGEGRPG